MALALGASTTKVRILHERPFNGVVEQWEFTCFASRLLWVQVPPIPPYKGYIMLDCLILGDSIAVGTKMFKQECADYAKGGITSHGWFKKYGNNDLSAKMVIISLGTNDWEKADTEAKLRTIRNKVKADKVFWIEPNIESKPDAVKHVNTVAKEFNDVVIKTTRWQKDKIHPSWAGYKSIADNTRL